MPRVGVVTLDAFVVLFANNMAIFRQNIRIFRLHRPCIDAFLFFFFNIFTQTIAYLCLGEKSPIITYLKSVS